jgi:hypothetical protein
MAVLKEREEMGVRHARAAQVYQQALLQPATAVLKKLRDDPDFMTNLLASDPHLGLGYLERFARALEIVVKVERLSRGEPVSIHEVNASVHETSGARDVASAILDDPETAEAASGLLARLNRVG